MEEKKIYDSRFVGKRSYCPFCGKKTLDIVKEHLGTRFIHCGNEDCNDSLKRVK